MAFGNRHEVDYKNPPAVGNEFVFQYLRRPAILLRVVYTALTGAIRQHPFSGLPRSAAKHAPESNLGTHSQAALGRQTVIGKSPILAEF
jgi:hypothetical protein